MQILQAAAAQSTNPWPLRRERAVELTLRYPHAADMLRLYQALLPAQEAVYLEFRSTGGQLEDIPDFAAERVLPAIVDATLSSGPTRLRDGVISVFCSADLKGLFRQWLDQEPLGVVETYLARACTSPLLEALTSSPSPLAIPSPSSLAGEGRGGGSRCPTCSGLPQLSYFAVSGEALVSGPRYLLCSRCAGSWVFSRMTCAYCGEATGARLPIFQEQEQFLHVRVDGCESCHRYLLTFDLRRDTRAVPVVDELAALPLDLYAIDQGLTKITPNLLGN